MTSRILSLLSPHSDLEVTRLMEPVHPCVLAITADIGFYGTVMSAANSLGWRTVWARWLDRAIEIYRPELMPIAIYDIDLPGNEWSRALHQLNDRPNPPCILLAARQVDEELWRNVLQGHGYDAVERSARPAHLARVFHFAWLSLRTGERSKP
jgi:DNA-binding response OmpR family regulator